MPQGLILNCIYYWRRGTWGGRQGPKSKEKKSRQSSRQKTVMNLQKIVQANLNKKAFHA